jgi:hypothetical protein
MSKWIEMNGNKYRLDGEFYIVEDESHIIYRGVKYNFFNNYYRRHHFSKEIPSNLQRAVWIDHFGLIPEGHHIHHKDGNKRNNHIENLQCLDKAIHISISIKNNKWLGSKGNLEHLESIREKSKAWHASKEGHEWHSKHGKNTWKNREKILKKCLECGNEYESWFSDSKYCHNRCKSRARRNSGVDNENRKCLFCKKYFIINRYKSQKTCSKTCGGLIRKTR